MHRFQKKDEKEILAYRKKNFSENSTKKLPGNKLEDRPR